jgi:hypothetical protein
MLYLKAIDEGRAKLQSLHAVIRRELEIKFREQEAFQIEKIPLETGFTAFLRSFGESWLT